MPSRPEEEYYFRTYFDQPLLYSYIGYSRKHLFRATSLTIDQLAGLV